MKRKNSNYKIHLNILRILVEEFNIKKKYIGFFTRHRESINFLKKNKTDRSYLTKKYNKHPIINVYVNNFPSNSKFIKVEIIIHYKSFYGSFLFYENVSQGGIYVSEYNSGNIFSAQSGGDNLYDFIRYCCKRFNNLIKNFLLI